MRPSGTSVINLDLKNFKVLVKTVQKTTFGD